MVKIQVLDSNCKPFKKFDDDACFDLRAREKVRIWGHETVRVPTGIKMAVPRNFIGDIRPRSSTSAKGLIVQGTIDPTYRGEVELIITNTTDCQIEIEQYERIAQCAIMAIDTKLEFVNELDETERGACGFGHTGRF